MKNTLLELEITNIVNGGYGLGRIDGLVHLVPYAYPGDIVLIKPTIKQKKLVWGEIKRILKHSPFRKEKLCPQMGLCGGCMWGMLDYQKQLEYKKQLLTENTKRFLNYESQNLEILYDDLNKFYYRTRVIYHGDGKRLGFYKFHSRQIVDVSKCILVHKNIEILRKELEYKNIKRDVYITINPKTYEYLIHPTNICKYFPKNLYGNINTNEYFIFDNIPVVNGSFSQNSLILNSMLKNQVKQVIQDENRILDLYCGSGNFTIDLDREKYVVGIDIDKKSIEIANKLSNFHYIFGNENVMVEYIEKEMWDTILLDPPRTGAKNIITSLANSKAKQIIYISC